MKKHFILFSFLLLGFVSNAQNFKGSMYGGFNFSHVRGDYMTGYNKPGVHLGVRVAYPFSESLDISMAMAYTQKGSRRTYDANGFPRSGTWHLLRANYIEVPITAHYRVFKNMFELQGGLSVSRLIGSYLSYNAGAGNAGQDFIRNNEYAVQFGASYIFSEKTHFYLRHVTSLLSMEQGSFSTLLSPYSRGTLHFVAMLGIEKKF